MARAVGVLLTSVAALAGCADPPMPSRRLSTEHFHIHSDTEVCEGLGDWYEQTYEAWSAYLGVDVPDGQRIVMAHYVESEDVHCACNGPPATGCTDGTTIWSMSTYDQHELAHVFAARLGNPPRVLEEGLAESLGCATSASAVVERSAEIADWLVGDHFERGSRAAMFARYGLAAAFVRYLIERFGSEPFLALYADVPHEPTRRQVDDAFRRHLDASVESVVADWLASPPQTTRSVCFPLTECSSPGIAVGTTDVSMTCGPRSVTRDLEVPQAVRTITVEADGRLGLRLSADTALSVSLEGCGVDVPPLHVKADAEEQVMLLADLTPATYHLWLATGRGSEASTAIAQAVRGEASLADTCVDAEAFVVDESLAEILLAMRGRRGTQWIGLRPEATVRLVLRYHAESRLEVSALTLCADDCETDCVTARSEEHGAGVAGTLLEAGRLYFLGVTPTEGVDVARMSLLFESPW